MHLFCVLPGHSLRGFFPPKFSLTFFYNSPSQHPNVTVLSAQSSRSWFCSVSVGYIPLTPMLLALLIPFSKSESSCILDVFSQGSTGWTTHLSKHCIHRLLIAPAVKLILEAEDYAIFLFKTSIPICRVIKELIQHHSISDTAEMQSEVADWTCVPNHCAGTMCI